MIQRVSETEVKPNRSYTGLSAIGGAAVGLATRCFVPLKSELSGPAKDSFFSSQSILKRCENRSIVKYASLGALLAYGVNKIVCLFTKEEQKDTVPEAYSKLGALIDAPDYSCEIMWS